MLHKPVDVCYIFPEKILICQQPALANLDIRMCILKQNRKKLSPYLNSTVQLSEASLYVSNLMNENKNDLPAIKTIHL
jgi:hypothetical protein